MVIMLYLSSNRRPYVDFTVQKCDRFTHYVKSSKENSVLSIFNYLKVKHKDGMILCPNNKLNVECYTDDDFSGMYVNKYPQYTIFVK